MNIPGVKQVRTTFEAIRMASTPNPSTNLCRIFLFAENFVKNKWKNIRDSFVKRIKVNFEVNGRCKYEDSLMFLRDMYSAKIENGTSQRRKGKRTTSTVSAAKKKPATRKATPKKAEASANRTPVSERTLRGKKAVVYREATPSSDDEETSTRRVTRASKRRAAPRWELLPAKKRRAEPTDEDVAEPLGDEDEQSSNVDDDSSSQSTGQEEEEPTGQEEEPTDQEEEVTGQEEEPTGQEEEESTGQEEEESIGQEEEEPTGEEEASAEEDAASQVDESGSQQDEEEPSNQEEFVRPNPADVTSSTSNALVQNLANGPMETLGTYRPSHVSFVSISSQGEVDEDVAFFKSILKMVKKFDDDEKLEFQTETLKLIQRIRSHKSVKNVYLFSPVLRMNS